MEWLRFLLEHFTVPTILVAVAAVMMIIERLYAGRQWPEVRGWWPRVILVNAFQAGIIWAAGFLWENWMKEHSLWQVTNLWSGWMNANFGENGTLLTHLLGAAVGYISITYVYYWWHRWRHEVNILWQCVHQLHHSPQIIRVETSFYKHPIEIASNGVIVSALLYLFLGLDVTSATWAILLSGLGEFFYHWNVPTPVWIGPFIQRPEAHCVHHQAQYHSKNFSDIPLWDMTSGLIGPIIWMLPKSWQNNRFCKYFRSTYFNPPKGYKYVCGFGHDENRLMALLLFQNVANEPTPLPEGQTPQEVPSNPKDYKSKKA